MAHLKTNDTVQIISGSHKGETGKIVKVDHQNCKAMVEGIGVHERHVAANRFNPNGSKKTIHVGIHLSNLKKIEKDK